MSQDENERLINDQDQSERDENGILSIPYQQYDGPKETYVEKEIPLTWVQKASFGVGHIYNDLCAAMWFSYTLLFLQVVLHMDSTVAGSMLLLGQVMDALATPVVGIFADRWGSKRIWHLGGTALVLVSFPMIFSRCLGCWMSPSGTYLIWWQPLYYGFVIVIFQCGWAIVQISHLAMIPALTQNLNERSELTAIRYTASVCSGVTVYVITWSILKINKSNNSLGPADDYKFRDVALVLTAIGCFLSATFHIGLQHQYNIDKEESSKKRKQYPTSLKEDEKESLGSLLYGSKKKTEKKLERKVEKKNFFLSPLLYQSALLYVASRIFSALTLVYMPLFLDERLNTVGTTETVESIASVPLVSYITSFFASILLKYRNKYICNKLLYAIGSLVSMMACLWVALSLDPSSGAFQLYAVAALLGAGSSITMVSSLCITADLIGPHSDQGAVVYSVVTFADKLITGLAVIVIENYKCENQEDCPQYYRQILAYVCGGSAFFGFTTILLSHIITLTSNKKKCTIT